MSFAARPQLSWYANQNADHVQSAMPRMYFCAHKKHDNKKNRTGETTKTHGVTLHQVVLVVLVILFRGVWMLCVEVLGCAV